MESMSRPKISLQLVSYGFHFTVAKIDEYSY